MRIAIGNKILNPNFFEIPEVKDRVEGLCDKNKNLYNNRFYHIVEDVLKRKPEGELSYAKIWERFKQKFCEEILYEAIEIALTENKSDLKENVVELLNDKRFREAVNGRALNTAFEGAIRQMPNFGGLYTYLNGGLSLFE